MLYLLVTKNKEDTTLHILPFLCGIYTRKTVAIVDAGRILKTNVCDLVEVYEIPPGMLNLNYSDSIFKNALLVFSTDKAKKKKVAKVM